MRIRNRYPLLLGVVSAFILAGGMLLKPARRAERPQLSETEMARLRRLAQRKSLQDITEYFAAAADQASAALVHCTGAAGGVVWNSAGRIVATHGGEAAQEGLEVVGPGGRRHAARVALTASEPPLAAVEAAGAGLQPALRAEAGSIEPGSWVMQVARSAEGRRLFVPAIFTGIAPARCGGASYRQVETSVPLSESMLGGGIFDTESRLLAIVARCGTRLTAVSAADIDPLLAHARPPQQNALARFGLIVKALDDELRTLLRARAGVLVSEVRLRLPAAAAGLAAGDVITGVNGDAVTSAEEVEARLQAGGDPIRLEVLRRGRKARITLSSPSEASPASGMVLAHPPAGIEIQGVLPDSPAMRSGIRSGDRLVRIDGRPVDRVEAAERVLSASNLRPAYLVMRRGLREWGVLIR